MNQLELLVLLAIAQDLDPLDLPVDGLDLSAAIDNLFEKELLDKDPYLGLNLYLNEKGRTTLSIITDSYSVVS